jgi:hypothetical protein
MLLCEHDTGTQEDTMGKHHDKIAAALKIRQDNKPAGDGFHKAGSMNKAKTGYPKTH